MILKYFLCILIIGAVNNSVFTQTKVNIENYSFEESGNEHWIIGENAEIQTGTSKNGKYSLLITHPEMRKSYALSGPVELEIGHLYKLSAWVKTENAVTSPLDRYPTSVAACLSMESFPFTNHSEAVGGTTDWKKIEVQFIASQKTDRVKLNFGHNGAALGKVWFDQVELEKVEDISEYIPYESVKWFNNAYRYDDKGWIFIHIEGKPYDRGYQYGFLVAEEMSEYITKLSIQQNKDNPDKGWEYLRFVANGFMLNKYEDEYITEMKGIADGANKTGIKLFKRKFDLIDIVAMNSAIDIDYSEDAVNVTPNTISGESFLKAEDELNIPNRLHKCSSFLANKSTTTDGRIVFGQIFMWGGYTGAHWNVICDVVPSEGNRLVYQTFPGGIHSGADFYMNSSGIMIGETTVAQTPFNPEGSPQSNRIRKAAQYANNIDDVVKILTTNNNGMYTNDWLIGDTKTDEIAVLLLGTYKHKLWRSSKNDFYGDTKDFYWCNNNNKDSEVRKEYISNPDNAPYDLIFNPWNRDIAFNDFYNEYKGKIDANAGVNLWASSPINRPHACDGKVTTSAMAENLVFLAHFGKVTLREKFVNENGRIPDLPGAFPHLTLGYSTVSPVFITRKLQELKEKKQLTAAKYTKKETKVNSDELSVLYPYSERKLWFNTVYPASESENWFISATAAYWQILRGMPQGTTEALNYTRDQLAELNCRYMYTVEKEGSVKPVDAKRIYTRYNNYQIPRIKGTYLLHQLRLNLGNDVFSNLMNKLHDSFRGKNISNKDFIKTVNQVSGKDLTAYVNQWITRDDLPVINFSYTSKDNSVEVKIKQEGEVYNFVSAVLIKTEGEQIYKTIAVDEKEKIFRFDTSDKVLSVEFNPLNDIPEKKSSYYTWANIFDDWKSAKIVYGTSRQIEANHSLALRFSTALGDRFTEDLIPVIKDNEITKEVLDSSDLIILGSVEDNSLMKRICEETGLKAGNNIFEWNGIIYNRPDDGLYVTIPNPYNPDKVLYLFVANSALELHQMTKIVNRMPQWAVFRGDKITEKGYHLK
jgi:hypothetical protein